MAIVEVPGAPETGEKRPEGGEKYKMVIEKPASGNYKDVQIERAGALDRAFKGKEELPQCLLEDIKDDDFFMRGQARQQAGEVKRLIPDKYFGDEETREEVSKLLGALRNKEKSLEELVADALGEEEDSLKKKNALKLVGVRLLQEHHPSETGVKWEEMSEDERRTVRVAEMMVHSAEMGALKRRLDSNSLDEKTARVFEKNYSHYARNVDIPKGRRDEYVEMVGLLRESSSDVEHVLTEEKAAPSGQETVVGAAEATVVEKGEQAQGKEKTGERTVREIEGEMRDVYEQIQRISGTAGSGALSEQVRARKQPEIDRLRQRWQELRDEIHTRAARERLQGVTIEWLEKVERELGEDVKVSPEEALDWAEEHDWEEKGKIKREEEKGKVAPYVKRGKKLKPLRKKRKL